MHGVAFASNWVQNEGEEGRGENIVSTVDKRRITGSKNVTKTGK